MKVIGRKKTVIFSLAVLSGCVGLKGFLFTPEFDKFKNDYKVGKYVESINYLMPEQKPTFDKSAFGDNAVIVGMEAGSASMSAGQFSAGTKYLDMAESSLSDGFSFSKYKPKFYEKVMLNTYKGIAFWGLGDIENAGVEFKRLNERQKEAVEENKKEILKAEEEASKQENSASFTATYEALEKEYDVYKNFKPYADFTNPFSTYISALYYLTAGYDKAEVENAINYMNRVNGMVSNEYVKADIKMAEDLANGKDIGSNVWVVYEEGLAPEIKEKVIKFPFPTKSGMKMVNFSLPEFVSKAHSYRNLTVDTSDGKYVTQPLVDMERVIKTEYQRRYPAEVAKGIVYLIASIAAQEIASQAITKSSFGKKLDKKMAKHGGLLGDLGKNKLGSKAVASAASVAIAEVISNKIDTTAWSSLPKEIQIAKLKMPKDRNVKIITAGALKTAKLKIDDKINNAIIYIRSPEAKGELKAFIINADGGK